MTTLEDARKTLWYKDMCRREMRLRDGAYSYGPGFDHWIRELKISQHRQGEGA